MNTNVSERAGGPQLGEKWKRTPVSFAMNRTYLLPGLHHGMAIRYQLSSKT
jgi:hypothetical protein